MKTPVPESFLNKLHDEVYNLIKKETPLQAFTCELC